MKRYFYGIGKENLALIRYLAAKDHTEIFFCCDDQASATGLAQQLEGVNFQQIKPERLRDAEQIFIAPGISIYQPKVQQLLAAGISLLSPNQYYFDHNQQSKVCITGSKGKSTTAKLLSELLEAHQIKTLLAGNIGEPLTAHIADQNAVAVIELSSYQTSLLQLKGHLAAVTSLFPEHLNWHLSEQQYYRDKLKIIKGSRKFALCSPENIDQGVPDTDELRNRAGRLSLAQYQSSLTGSYFAPRHLRNNLAIALTLLAEVLAEHGRQIESEKVDSVVRTFSPLAHRFELIHQFGNSVFYDDSISTTPESAIVALEATAADYDQQIILLGGFNRGVRQEKIVNYLNEHPGVKAILMPETGPLIADGLSTNNFELAEGLESALKLVKEQKNLVESKTAVLFSPGAASYHQFANFAERGDKFVELVRCLF